MATPTSFNLNDNQKAERKLLVTAVNVGTGETEDWEIIGAGVEESAIELNMNSESITDILGVTETSITKSEPKQTFEPYTIRGGSKLAFILDDIITRNALSELSAFKVLIAKGYIGEGSAYKAEVHKNCTITVTSYGGSAYVDMPIEISFSNDKEHGTVDKISKGLKFTKTASV